MRDSYLDLKIFQVALEAGADIHVLEAHGIGNGFFDQLHLVLVAGVLHRDKVFELLDVATIDDALELRQRVFWVNLLVIQHNSLPQAGHVVFLEETRRLSPPVSATKFFNKQKKKTHVGELFLVDVVDRLLARRVCYICCHTWQGQKPSHESSVSLFGRLQKDMFFFC